MKIKIEGYKEGKFAFHNLIYDLEALVNILENKDEQWRESFISYWENLEDTYALNLYLGKETFDENDKLCIDNSVINIEKLVDLKLNELKQKGFHEYEDMY